MMKFEIDDEIYESSNNLPVAVSKILSIVQSMPEGKLYTTRRLAQKIGYSHQAILNYTAHPAIKEYKILARNRSGRCNLFGNTETICTYREENEIE